jgi:hypothetical protein
MVLRVVVVVAQITRKLDEVRNVCEYSMICQLYIQNEHEQWWKIYVCRLLYCRSTLVSSSGFKFVS